MTDRASDSYRGRPEAESLALRNLADETVGLTGDLLVRRYKMFLRHWVETGDNAAVVPETGKDRSNLSRDYRPQVITVKIGVFIRLTRNGDRCRSSARPSRGSPRR